MKKQKVVATPPTQINGISIRFSTEAYKNISAFCKSKGYKIGAFCEIAATEKINKEKASQKLSPAKLFIQK